MNGTKKTPDKICFVSIDVESDFAKNKTFKGIENLDKILSIFKRCSVRATLFITGEVLEKCREKAKEWTGEYEIACHSFTHRFWDSLDGQERKDELEKFIILYQKIFNQTPKGFRAPSHIIDREGLKLLKEKGFLYDSSIVPYYPFFKKYRGYKPRRIIDILRGKKRVLASPYYPAVDNCTKQGEMKILEIPVAGQIFGIPLAGAWISKLPFFIYEFLFAISEPDFLTLSFHSWDSLNPKLLEKIEKILKLLRNKNYQFLKGEEIFEKYASISKNRG